MSGIIDEVDEAVSTVFDELGDMAKLTLRRYQRGLGAGSPAGVPQARILMLSVHVTGIIAWPRGGDKVRGLAKVYVHPDSLGAAGAYMSNPEGDWTVQDSGADELPVTKWRPFGPEPGKPSLWKATVVTGGGAGGETEGGTIA